jgi:hypothetical protein
VFAVQWTRFEPTLADRVIRIRLRGIAKEMSLLFSIENTLPVEESSGHQGESCITTGSLVRVFVQNEIIKS